MLATAKKETSTVSFVQGRLFDGPITPGKNTILMGNYENGYCGTVSADIFITGKRLSEIIGLEAGSPIKGAYKWFKVMLSGKILFVASRPLRFNLSWDDIYRAGAVYGNSTVGMNPLKKPRIQDANVVIDGVKYIVRLLRGGDFFLTHTEMGYNALSTLNSEWNRILYPLHSGDHFDDLNDCRVQINNKIFIDRLIYKDFNLNQCHYGHWASHTDDDLVTHFISGPGSYTWCQETPGKNASDRIIRGCSGVSFINHHKSNFASINMGWRPVLEAVI